MTLISAVHLEKYTLETELSRDAWSTLYHGCDKATGCPALVRVVTPLFATDEFFARRFILMAEQNANLEHPNILPTQAAEQDDDWLYVVQDFIEARPLAEVIAREAPLSLKRVQFIVSQIASALDYAHQKSITHGSLSAHHVYVGQKDRVWLTGFGHSQLLFGANIAKYGWPGDNPEVLAPERVQGQGPSRQADLYSLGVLCYQMLANQLPFAGPASAVRHAQAYRQPRPLHQVNTSISLLVSETVSRMLAKSVDVRYNTGAEFARAFLMAAYKRHTPKGYDYLIPMVERERRRSFTLKGVTYFSTALILVLFVTLLAIWAGYELGLKQAVSSRPTPQVVVVTRTTPASVDRPNQAEDTLGFTAPTDETPLIATPTAIPTATPESLVVLSDRLQPLPNAPVFDRLLPIAPPTTTPNPPTSTPIVSTGAAEEALSPATAAPVIPIGQGMFVFSNPTGHDLVVDLTGPTTTSILISPNQHQEVSLEPGPYQYIIHTVTGQWLPTQIGTFALSGGQVVEKDYYSQHDLTLQ